MSGNVRLSLLLRMLATQYSPVLAVSSTTNNLDDRFGRALELVRSDATRPFGFAIPTGSLVPLAGPAAEHFRNEENEKETTSPWPKDA
jgi:hypothetical protein